MFAVAGLMISLLGFLGDGASLREGESIHAYCDMKQHNDGAFLGPVYIDVWPGNDIITISANLESDIIKVGKHGFHVHENPVQGLDCLTAGGHFNPFGRQHGGLYGSPDDLYERHVGDLGNFLAGDGQIMMDLKFYAESENWKAPFSLHGENSIRGRSLVLHADEDDLGLGNYSDSKTTGHAGSRLACCSLY